LSTFFNESSLIRSAFAKRIREDFSRLNIENWIYSRQDSELLTGRNTGYEVVDYCSGIGIM